MTNTIDSVIASLCDFIQPFMPSGTVLVQSQANRVTLPASPCVVLTPLFGVPLEYTSSTFSPDDGKTTYLRPMRLDIQIDFYDVTSGDMVNVASTLLRSDAATTSSAFSDGVTMLYVSDSIQSPLITGEAQYQDRWTLTASLQYNSSVSIDTPSFNTVGIVGIDPADVTTLA